MTFQTTAPLPTYLVALAVGAFDIVEWAPIPPNAVRSRPLPLRGIAPKGEGGEFRYALEHTASMLARLEAYFAIPYPYAKLDLVAVAQFRSGGMENAGAIFYRRNRILLGERNSIYQRRGFAYIHAHELAHSWFGNLVTPVWWDDLWLNEAFATWLADRIVHEWRPDEFDNRGPIRSAGCAMWSDRLASARQIRQPINTNHDIWNAFDRITYSKGGGVLAMIERHMGPAAFRAGVRRYIGAHRHGVASAQDFYAALSESAGDPALVPAFRSFLEQPGTPMVDVAWSCRASGAVEVTLRQSRGLPLGSKGDARQTWSIPLCLVYPDQGKRARHCTILAAREATLSLPTTGCPSWVLPNQDGAAYMNFTLPEAGWRAVLANFGDLAPGEALSLVASIGAAHEAGRATTETLLAVARAAAASSHWDVVKAPMQDLRDLKNFIAPPELKPRVKQVMREIYRPALARLDLGDGALAKEADDSAVELLRGDLLWFMALDAEDPGLRAILGRLGRAYLGDGPEGSIDPDVLHPNLVRVALIVAAQEGGVPFAETLIARLARARNSTLRSHLIGVLGFQRDGDVVKRVSDLILDPSLSKRDASDLLRRQSRMSANREVVFNWIVAHYDELLERLPRSHRKWLPWRASAFCSNQDRDRVEAFFAERIGRHSGGPRVLANVLEAIEICAAVVAAQRADAVAALTAHR